MSCKYFILTKPQNKEITNNDTNQIIYLNNYKSYIYKQSNLSIVCSNKSIRDFYHNWAKSFDEIFFKKICLNNNLMFN